MVTGDEPLRSGRPAPGQVRDALGPLPPPLARTLGGEVTDVRPVPNHPAGSPATVVLTTSYDTEVIVVTGSTSVGVTDQLRRLPAEHGARWVVDAVAVRPAHPQLLAQLSDHRWLVGLAGNPYADLPAAHTPLAPLLAGLTGRPLSALPRIPLTGDIAPAPGRTRLISVTWDGATASPVGGHRPAFLPGAALAAVPPHWQPHTPVPLLLLTGEGRLTPLRR
ncbi:molybdopterin-binding protein [Streptomyces mirabilis]|uniref:molybdopterin-binding protein n=1 Tax=Streptomyces mirabilis TaxID=68239 RepID=UPI0037192D66